MDIKDILSVGLTAEDFDTMLQGLDAIPDKLKAEEGLKGLMGHMLGSLAGAPHRKELDHEFDRKMKDVERKCAAQKEDLIVLKSKLILLKRLLASNEAVKMANDILHATPPHTSS